MPNPPPTSSPGELPALERARELARTHLDPLAPYALSFARAACGFFLAAHGLSKLDHVERFAASLASKGFPAATMFAWLAIFGELVCGTLLGLGAATRVAAAFASFTMLVAILSSHLSDIFEIGTKRGIAFEFPAILGLVALSFVFAGSGPAGIDAILAAPSGEPEAPGRPPAPGR